MLPFLIVPAAAFIAAFPLEAQTREWVRLYGNASEDIGTGLAIDRKGAIYVAGHLDYGRDHTTRAQVACLLKFDAGGDLLWSRNWGHSRFIHTTGMAAFPDGGVVIAGIFSGILEGHKAGDNPAAFLTRFDAEGRTVWTRAFGSTRWLGGKAIAVDSKGGIYLTGEACGKIDDQPDQGRCDAFLVKYSKEGDKLWTRRFGFPKKGGNGRAVAVDPRGDILVAGHVDSADSRNGGLFLAKYDAQGISLWTSLHATGGTYSGAYGLAVDPKGNSYITGMTGLAPAGSGPGGSDDDAFLMKYDPSGNLVWSRVFGTDSVDIGEAVALGADGRIYVTGSSGGKLPGIKRGGDMDVLLATFDGGGNWTRTWASGLRGHDAGAAMAFGPDGRLYLAGTTSAGMEGQKNAGGRDILLMKFVPWSASFDCAKAATAPEKLICGSERLAALDVDLDSLFKVRKQAAPVPARIVADQKAWLQQRNACTTAEALEASMVERIGQLRSLR